MQTEGMSDTELLERARAGEPACYGVLVTRHHRRLYRAAQRILRNEADAEDAVQEAYVNGFRSLHQFQGRSAVATWLTSIAVNEAFTCVRHRIPCHTLDAPVGGRNLIDFLASPVRDPEKQATSRQLATWISAAVAALPEEYRVVFKLREMEGVNTLEAATRLGISENCLRTRLFRAKTMLRRRLGADWGPARSSRRTSRGAASCADRESL